MKPGNEHARRQILEIHIDYDEFLNANQLSSILHALDRLYTALYVGYFPETSVPLPLGSRLRVKTCRTGQSIGLELVEGIRQIWEGTRVQIVPVEGVIILAMGHVLLKLAQGFIELRKAWYEGERVRLEAEKQRRQLEAYDRERLDLSKLPEDARGEATKAAVDFLTEVEHAPNIVKVRVNGVVIVDKRAFQGNRQEN